ncbi:hypothetical protein [Streptomyces sp. NRRL S-146]
MPGHGHSDRPVSFACTLEDHAGALAARHAVPFAARRSAPSSGIAAP